MKTKLITLIVMLISLSSFAQEFNRSNPEYLGARATLNMIPEIEIGFAIDDFEDKIERDILIGKGVSVFYRLKKKPIDIGLRIGGFSYDHTTRIYDGNRQKNKNKIWNCHAAFRFEPLLNLPVQPYFEGSLGFNHYKTKTYTKQIGARLLDFIFETDEGGRFNVERLHSDWGTNYGGAIGCYLFLNKEHHSAIDIQVGYRSGSTAKFYVAKGGTIKEDPIDNYEERESALSLISLKIGVSVMGF